VIAAWRSRGLVIVIAPERRRIGGGHERAYRLRVTAGRVTGEDVGDAAAARDAAERLYSDPGDRDAARELGRIVVPRDAASATLHVLAIGPLGKVPLAALRDDDGALVLARRPLARVLALAADGPESAGTGAPVVIANPRGDLVLAAVEGAVVGAVLGPRARLSGVGTAAQATRERLWAATDAELLHLAGHVRARAGVRVLPLVDAEVGPAEIVDHHLAPRIAVLAACGSAAATDEEGWGSFAAALLEAGTAVVIATDRSVGDAAALAVMRAFYAQPDWRADPERALARVQQALAARGDGSDEARPASWAAFSVLRRPPRP
jgi:CHAT domain-containing protein